MSANGAEENLPTPDKDALPETPSVHKCGRLGHFQHLCKTRQKICDVTEEEDDYIHTVEEQQ